MKVIILAAGYATRLYPLTLTQPKPLLPVAGKPMVDHVLDNLAAIPGLTASMSSPMPSSPEHFQKWADTYRKAKAKIDFTVVNDGFHRRRQQTRRHRRLPLVLKKEKVDDDIIVVAGDNLFNQKLDGYVHFANNRKAPVLAVYDVGNLEEIKKYNSITIDGDGEITFFEEKPKNPTSTLTGIALYYYPNQLPLIHQYIAEKNNPDQPGRLVQWLYPRMPFYTWRVPGILYDIGSKETLEEANKIF